MGDFITGPFPGSAIPLFFDEMGRDVAKEDFRTIRWPPSRLRRIVGVPHTKALIGITVRRFLRAIDEYAWYSG
jgi:hypothetical protein